MAEARNAHCFSEPHWRVIASGFSTESWFGDGQVVGTGGILNPMRTHLRVGQRYYRFASSTSGLRGQVGGGWWIEYAHFAVIKDFAAQHGYQLGDAARLFLALPYEWTRVDRLVSAILEVPLDAYVGHGKVAQSTKRDPRDRESKWVPVQHQPVAQLYVPGLVSLRTDSSRGEHDLYKLAFPNPTLQFVHSGKAATGPK